MFRLLFILAAAAGPIDLGPYPDREACRIAAESSIVVVSDEKTQAAFICAPEQQPANTDAPF
jgi:hypothetical protein